MIPKDDPPDDLIQKKFQGAERVFESALKMMASIHAELPLHDGIICSKCGNGLEASYFPVTEWVPLFESDDGDVSSVSGFNTIEHHNDTICVVRCNGCGSGYRPNFEAYPEDREGTDENDWGKYDDVSYWNSEQDAYGQENYLSPELKDMNYEELIIKLKSPGNA